MDRRIAWLCGRAADVLQLAEDRITVAVQKPGESLRAVQAFLGERGGRVLFCVVAPDGAVSFQVAVESELRGRAAYFLRTVERSTLSSFETDVLVGLLPADDTEHQQLVLHLSAFLEAIHQAALKGSSELDALGTDDEHLVPRFLRSVARVAQQLEAAMRSLQNAVRIPQPALLEAYRIENKPTSYMRAASIPEVVRSCEAALDEWIHLISGVLDEPVPEFRADQGPDAELEMWKARCSTLSSISEQIKGRACKTVIGVLQAAKSLALLRWKDFDARLTDATNEAKDNIKYLGTLSRFLEPLYGSDPQELLDSIAGVVKAVAIMHTVARYYNSPERMRRLFGLVANQLVVNCRAYVARFGSLWMQPRAEAAQRLRACIDLAVAFQQAYRSVQAGPARNQLIFNESSVFAHLVPFVKRARACADIIDTIDSFSRIAEASVDGIEPILQRFELLASRLRLRTYDPLDIASTLFETDYLEFSQVTSDLERELRQWIATSLDAINDTKRALATLSSFQTIFQRETLRPDFDSRYRAILQKFATDLESVRKMYETEKENPPLPRNFPPVSGRIAWARQLLRAIEEPVRELCRQESLMKSPDGRRVMKAYNKLAATLVEFEVQWHAGWAEAVETAKSGLMATVLVRHPDNPQKIYVNFDSEVMEVMRETREFIRLGLDVPVVARNLLAHESRLKRFRSSVQSMLEEAESLAASIPFMFKRLMRPHISELTDVIALGLTKITWASVNIEVYIGAVGDHLKRLRELVAKVRDCINHRIDAPLKEMERAPTLALPVDQPDIVSRVKESAFAQMAALAKTLDSKQYGVENAVYDVIDLITAEFTPVQQQRYKTDAALVVRYYYAQAYQALLGWTKRALNELRQRISENIHAGLLAKSLLNSAPLFRVEVVLMPPRIALRPSLEEIQKSINQTALAVLRVSRSVYTWGQDRSRPPAELKSYNNDISRSRDIVKVVLRLAGSFTSLRNEVDKYLRSLSTYEFLWKESVQHAAEGLQRNSPSEEFIETQLNFFAKHEAAVRTIPTHRAIGPLMLDSEMLRTALLNEIAAWKQMYGACVNQRITRSFEETVEILERTTADLNRRTEVDLDDARATMETLDRLREMESAIELRIRPMDDAVRMLQRFNVRVDRVAAEAVENLQYRWQRVRELAAQRQERLSLQQGKFREELAELVRQFRVDVRHFCEEYSRTGPLSVELKPRLAYERVVHLLRQVDDLKHKHETVIAGETLFGLPLTEAPELVRIRRELTHLHQLYQLNLDLLSALNVFAESPWRQLDTNGLVTLVAEHVARFRRLPAQAMRTWDGYRELRRTLDDLSELVPLLTALRSPAVQERHWQQIMRVTGVHLKVDSDTFQLKELLNAPLLVHKDAIDRICQSASKEVEIETTVMGIIAEWKERELDVVESKHRGIAILNSVVVNEITAKLEDSLMVLNALLGNRYNVPFLAVIQQWIGYLTTCVERLELWTHVQSLWMYMEAVFSAGDIARQLPHEAKRFANIDKSWIKVMATAAEKRNVVACCCDNDTLKNLLPILSEQLEQCQKSLSTYLDSKRSVFPRFYFVSDAVLLEILGQSGEILTVRQHLGSMFDNVADFVTERAARGTRITHIVSREGEQLPLRDPCIADGSVEMWLTRLLNSMRASVQDLLHEAVSTFDSTTITEFVRKRIAQAAIVGLQIKWTELIESAFLTAETERNPLVPVNKQMGGYLRELVGLCSHDLPMLDRIKTESIVVIAAHLRDALDQLHKMRVRSMTDFEWQKLLRVYFRKEQRGITVALTDVEFSYSHEYLGCTDRLVMTPLTDRCYITLAQACSLCNGGAPVGPAGTGKTETVKDMGKSLGQFVLVFNCSDQMDYQGLGKTFKGIAHCGIWGCFDEFNRINIEVLSVAAQQVSAVLTALREHRQEVLFADGSSAPLMRSCGIFITMNPQYIGRQDLPENLKMSFRFVAMMVPNRQIIMRVKLASAGFQDSILLAKKFNTFYSLCEEQLSSQKHYDFGLRSVLAVLRACGVEKRRHPELHEEVILMRVLRDMNVSKLVEEDEPVFHALLADVFPGLRLPVRSGGDVAEVLPDVLRSRRLTDWAPWTAKVLQLHETTSARHGVILLGASGTGKTCAIHALLDALSRTGSPFKEIHMNPKAVTTAQMFGRHDMVSNEWKDGIFARLWRDAAKRPSWIVLDGPIDSLWMENMNTVLDDNRVLTLANSDRIPMPPHLHLVFEVASLANASPATVSRTGVVYFSPAYLGWRPILDAWLASHSQYASGLRVLFDRVWDPLCEWERETWPDFAGWLGTAHQIEMCCTVLHALVSDYEKAGKERHATPPVLERMFVFALAWTKAAVLAPDDRIKLHLWLQQSARLDLPPSDSVFEYFVDGSTGEWQHWRVKVPPYEPRALDYMLSFADIIVPTVETVRLEFMLSLAMAQQHSPLIVGEGGTGKTATIKSFLRQCLADHIQTKTICFSSATTTGAVQKFIEDSIDKRVGSSYGPPGNKKLVVFLDDINFPAHNEWGDQPANELVRQLVEQSGFYNLDRPGEFIRVEDVAFIAAMRHPSSGHRDIPARLKRHFWVLLSSFPPASSLDAIFGMLLAGRFSPENGFSHTVSHMARQTIPVMLRQLWWATKQKMLPTPGKVHYVFNMRDLSRVVQGMVRCLPQVVKTPVDLLRLWAHESTRVLADRFVQADDVEWFQTALASTLAHNEQGAHVQEQHGPRPSASAAAAESAAAASAGSAAIPTITVDAGSTDTDAPADLELDDDEPDGSSTVVPLYEPVFSAAFLREKVEAFQSAHNAASRSLKLESTLFDEALQNVIRIARVLFMPGGNALLLGIEGAGKQTLARLAAYIVRSQVVQFGASRTFNIVSFLEDLRHLFRVAGQRNESVTYLVTDRDIRSEQILEHLNNLLTVGEVPNLFNREDMEAIVADLRPTFQKVRKGEPDTYDNVLAFFKNQVRNNLHLILCFSPVGDGLRPQTLKFPGLLTGCTVIFFSAWPPDALREVTRTTFSTFALICTPEQRTSFIDFMACVHANMVQFAEAFSASQRRSVHVTPKMFSFWLSTYKRLYALKQDELQRQQKRVRFGLEKLDAAEREIVRMRANLQEKDRAVTAAQKQTQGFLEEITAQTADAERRRSEIAAERDKLRAQRDVIEEQKREAERDLEAARPALEEALSALNVITAPDIAAIKHMKKPPNLIKRVMDTVLILLGRPLERVREDSEAPRTDKALGIGPRTLLVPSWDEAVNVLSDGDFLQVLNNYKKEWINDEMCELLQPYFEMVDFNVELARKVCGNVGGLITWVKAMVRAHNIAKTVEPKQRKLYEAEARLFAASTQLRQTESVFQEREQQLARVRAKYEGALARRQALLDEAERLRQRTERAELLIAGLADERRRWTAQQQSFDDRIQKLIGDAALAAAFVNYCGPYSPDFRQEMISSWREALDRRHIPCSDESFTPVSFLAHDAEIGQWTLQGLPNDTASVQNAVILAQTRVLYTMHSALIIDPQGQGRAWIMHRETSRGGVRVVRSGDPSVRKLVEQQLQSGGVLVVEDCEDVTDPVLAPVIESHIAPKQGGGWTVVFPDKEVELVPGFWLVLTTRNPNPVFGPETFGRVALVNFALAAKGLEDQLLGRVIMLEREALETQRKRLIEEETTIRGRIFDLEEKLLNELATYEGDLLDNTDLLSLLSSTKRTVLEAHQALASATEAEAKLSAAREEYRPIAQRGTVLFFVVGDMTVVCNMYQMSLRQFMRLFDHALQSSARSPVVGKRVSNVVERLTTVFCAHVQRGLYEQHRLLFALQTSIRIEFQSRKMTQREVQFLIGTAPLGPEAIRLKDKPWIPDPVWANLCRVSGIQELSSIFEHLHTHEAAWRRWYESPSPESQPFPGDFNLRVSPFYRMLLLRAFCEERFAVVARQYATETLGVERVEGRPLEWEEVYTETDARTPVMCLITAGSDPTATIEAMAKRMQREFRIVSMGQGQDAPARRLLAHMLPNGGWLMLQNAHLSVPFMQEFAQTLAEAPVVHEAFRAWITCVPHDAFPIDVLHSAIKCCSEQPQGLRAGLLRAVRHITQDMLDTIDRAEWRSVLYGVCYLHAALLERRRFGALGWNVPYEFNSGDLSGALLYLQNYLYQMDTRAGRVSWPSVRYMVCEVLYGGRVTDEQDRRMLAAYGSLWFDDVLLRDKFSFVPEQPAFGVPQRNALVSDLLAHVEALPRDDTPELLGLHRSAEQWCLNAQSRSLTGELSLVLPRAASPLALTRVVSGAGGGTTLATLRSRAQQNAVLLEAVDDALRQLPRDIPPANVMRRIATLKGGLTSPLNIFLRQELARLRHLLLDVRTELLDMRGALVGTVVLSDTLLHDIDMLASGRVPPHWIQRSFGARNLARWLLVLQRRASQLETWLGQDKPNVFWLSGLFNPQGFLTAVKQEIKRLHASWPIDSMSMHTQVLKRDPHDALLSPPDDGSVYIHGLFLEGASWDRRAGKLRDPTGRSLLTEMPVMHVTAFHGTATPDPRAYMCPVYKSPSRTDANLIFHVYLHTDEPPDKWIRRGAALLASEE